MMVSVNAEDLAAVVELACLTESRSNSEQKALLAVAERLDKRCNAKVGANLHPKPGAMWMMMSEEDRVGTDADNWVVRVRPESQAELDAHHSRRLEEDHETHVKPSWERKKRR